MSRPLAPAQPSTGKIPFLDTVRGVAILMVYACHSLDFAYKVDNQMWTGVWRNLDWPGIVQWLFPLHFGHLGVAVFFVISGLCIQLSWRKTSMQGWLAFFNRRFFRIYPPYLLAVMLFTFAPVVALSGFNLLEWLSHVLLVHNLKPEWAWGINSSFWSIAVEWQLYLVFPLLVWLRQRLGWRLVLITLGMLELVLRLSKGLTDSGILTHGLPFPLVYSPVGFWFSWALGAWLADAFLDKRLPVVPKLTSWVLFIALLGILSCRVTDPLACPVTALLLTSLMINRLKSPAQPNTPSPFQWLRRPGRAIQQHLALAGTVSYSLYLIHQPFLLRVIPLLFQQAHIADSIETRFITAIAAWPIMVLLSWGLFHLLEQPSIHLGHTVLVWITATFSTKPKNKPISPPFAIGQVN